VETSACERSFYSSPVWNAAGIVSRDRSVVSQAPNGYLKREVGVVKKEECLVMKYGKACFSDPMANFPLENEGDFDDLLQVLDNVDSSDFDSLEMIEFPHQFDGLSPSPVWVTDGIQRHYDSDHKHVYV